MAAGLVARSIISGFAWGALFGGMLGGIVAPLTFGWPPDYIGTYPAMVLTGFTVGMVPGAILGVAAGGAAGCAVAVSALRSSRRSSGASVAHLRYVAGATAASTTVFATAAWTAITGNLNVFDRWLAVPAVIAGLVAAWRLPAVFAGAPAPLP